MLKYVCYSSWMMWIMGANLVECHIQVKKQIIYLKLTLDTKFKPNRL